MRRVPRVMPRAIPRVMPRLLAAALTAMAVPFAAVAAEGGNSMLISHAPQISVDDALVGNRIAESRDWRPHFRDISRGGIVIETDENRLSYWGPGGATYIELPVATPRDPSLGRTGRTTVTWKRKDPDWRPTEDMKRRNPSLPDYMGPGPRNPLGTRAMYLDWPAYAIHGTNDPTSIGRAASSGCFRLFPQHVEMLYEHVQAGTPVVVY